MDFNEIKKKALEMKNKALKYSSEKLMDSSLTITKKEDLESFLEKSKDTFFKNLETRETKTYKHRVLVIFGEKESDFFKEALYMLPILATKGFSQNTPIKLATQEIAEGITSEFPALVVYQNKEIIKKVYGRENILKLVKSFDLDINKEIDNL